MEGAVGSAGSGHHQDLICRTSGDREPMLLSLSSQVGHKQFVHPGGLLESCAESEGGSGVLNEKESTALSLVALSLLAHWVSFGWAGRKVTLVQLAERWWHRAQGWQLAAERRALLAAPSRNRAVIVHSTQRKTQQQPWV